MVAAWPSLGGGCLLVQASLSAPAATTPANPASACRHSQHPGQASSACRPAATLFSLFASDSRTLAKPSVRHVRTSLAVQTAAVRPCVSSKGCHITHSMSAGHGRTPLRIRRGLPLYAVLYCLVALQYAVSVQVHASCGIPTMEPHKADDYPFAEADALSESLSAEQHMQLLGQVACRKLLQAASAPEPGSVEFRRSLSRRCRMSRGDWCGQYDKQATIPSKPVPRGNKECPKNCSNNGNCNYDFGICECPAGWTGDDCSKVLLRPCTNRFRRTGNETVGHVDADGRDLNWLEPGWIASRCGGICDVTIAACFCDGKYKHIPAPKGSPYGTRPVQWGRMLGDHCNPKSLANGTKTSWGNTDYDKLYGKQGYCEAEYSVHNCGCMSDGRSGSFCDVMYEPFCINQCSGHGECIIGFCKCREGWYGTDCSRKKAGMMMEPSDVEGSTRPWLKPVVELPPAAAEVPAAPTRKRPLIYIYDLPPEFNTRLHQYKVSWQTCTYRKFLDHDNSSMIQRGQGYGIETYFLEALMQSEHRTFDPEEADFFYVPIFLSCLMYPVFAWADFPWYYGPIKIRPYQAANFVMEAKKWIQKTHPYWDRKQGRDHIWMPVHDEGACYWPTEVYNNSIMLTHWGRMDADHKSNTAYGWDNYTHVAEPNEWSMGDWRDIYKGHLCYTPGKDLVIPQYKPPAHYHASPLIGAAPMQRIYLMSFIGDCGKRRLPHYSRAIRQKVLSYAKEHKWKEKYNIVVGTPQDIQLGSYSSVLAQSKYCLVAPGDGHSARAEDSVLHGCIPVVVMDHVHAVYESILEYDLFSVRINERSLHALPEILNAISEDNLKRMQMRLQRVWHRYAYTTGVYTQGMFEATARQQQGRDAARDAAVTPSMFSPVKPFPHQDDAFHTIMQWLYAKKLDMER